MSHALPTELSRRVLFLSSEVLGADDRHRTCNPLITSQVLCQLSYASLSGQRGRVRVELPFRGPRRVFFTLLEVGLHAGKCSTRGRIAHNGAYDGHDDHNGRCRGEFCRGAFHGVSSDVAGLPREATEWVYLPSDEKSRDPFNFFWRHRARLVDAR